MPSSLYAPAVQWAAILGDPADPDVASWAAAARELKIAVTIQPTPQLLFANNPKFHLVVLARQRPDDPEIATEAINRGYHVVRPFPLDWGVADAKRRYAHAREKQCVLRDGLLARFAATGPVPAWQLPSQRHITVVQDVVADGVRPSVSERLLSPPSLYRLNQALAYADQAPAATMSVPVSHGGNVASLLLLFPNGNQVNLITRWGAKAARDTLQIVAGAVRMTFDRATPDRAVMGTPDALESLAVPHLGLCRMRLLAEVRDAILDRDFEPPAVDRMLLRVVEAVEAALMLSNQSPRPDSRDTVTSLSFR